MELMRCMFLHLLFVILLTVRVSAYPRGAPEQNYESCFNLNPVHANAMYFSPSPYFIQTSQQIYTYCNDTSSCQRSVIAARIQIQGQGALFRGFIIQARTPSGGSRSWGQFFPTQNDAKIIRCQNGLTLTHTANNDKQTVTFQWIPEPNMREQVQFVATVVQNLRTIYPRVYSQALRPIGVGGSNLGVMVPQPVTRPPLTTPVPTRPPITTVTQQPPITIRPPLTPRPTFTPRPPFTFAPIPITTTTKRPFITRGTTTRRTTTKRTTISQATSTTSNEANINDALGPGSSAPVTCSASFGMSAVFGVLTAILLL